MYGCRGKILQMVILIVAFLGLAFGSFVNALVFRLHMQSKRRLAVSDKRLAKKAKGQQLKASSYSVLKGRSMCPHCRHQLEAIDLIPLISWLALRGKCRYCNKPISAQYPLVELSTAALFLLSYILFPYYNLAPITYNLLLLLWLAILTGLIALFVYDLKWMILPNKIVFPLIFLASAHAFILMLQSDSVGQWLLGLGGSLAVSFGLFYLLFQLSDGRWIGGGDVKFSVVYALLLADPLKSGMVLFAASLIGTTLVLPSLLNKQRDLKAKLPFGPLLITATIIVYLFGHHLAVAYSSFVGI